MGMLTISEVAGRHLDQWADAVLRGELQVWQLPLAVQQFVSIGWNEAHALSRAEVARLERDLNYWHHIATTTEQQRNQTILDRLNQGLAEAEAETWDRLEHDLRLAAALGTDSLPERRAAA